MLILIYATVVIFAILCFCCCICSKKSWNLNTCLALSVSSLFYRDVEGVEPAAQRERVHRPENYSWRQRVWSPPKCSSFLQLVFQGPGEKVCLPPFPPAVDPICSFRRAHLCHFFPPSVSLLQVCRKTLVSITGPAAIHRFAQMNVS